MYSSLLRGLLKPLLDDAVAALRGGAERAPAACDVACTLAAERERYAVGSLERVNFHGHSVEAAGLVAILDDVAAAL